MIGGDPVAKLRALELYNHLFQRHGVDALLVPMKLAPDRQAGFVRHAGRAGTDAAGQRQAPVDQRLRPPGAVGWLAAAGLPGRAGPGQQRPGGRQVVGPPEALGRRIAQSPTDSYPYLDALVEAFTLDACQWSSGWPFLKASERLDVGPFLRLIESWLPDAADPRPCQHAAITPRTSA